MNKTVILYIAVENEDTNFFLYRLKKQFLNCESIKVDYQHKTLETPKHLVEVITLNNIGGIGSLFGADYFLMSEKLFQTSISKLEELYGTLQLIKSRLHLGAEEITRCRLISMLNGFEDKQYCCTCKWYDTDNGTCFNGDSEHRADFRCLDDSCECWEGVENENS